MTKSFQTNKQTNKICHFLLFNAIHSFGYQIYNEDEYNHNNVM